MKKITIKIQVNWGSKFQEAWLKDVLSVMLSTWKNVGESKHKQNKISYEIDTHDGYKIKKF